MYQHFSKGKVVSCMSEKLVECFKRTLNLRLDLFVDGHTIDLRYESDGATESVVAPHDVLVRALAEKGVNLPRGHSFRGR